ncbi:hypothetical protein BDZ94DRAFT_1306522 [Collybia nuda]|uniref:BTB domain-containing protein n=1 Tax=Collybia nuda TaxID=64659 RepID=A0A9P5YEE8_9AGAR|nr:hypothetical protein BDZ94DRAFT_1306522 [Collybia nuda]
MTIQIDEIPDVPLAAHIHSPFDQPQNADIVLRSSDGEDFFTRRILLSLSSDVFDSMFTLPQACKEPNGVEQQNDPPVIALTEEGNMVYQLLQWIDPRCTPSWELKDMQLVLHAADKYNMQGVMHHIEKILTRCTEYVGADPVRIYAIAIRYGFRDLARAAAKESLRLTPEERTNIPELVLISAEALQHLYIYYFACAKASHNLAADFLFSWLGDARFVWGPDSPKDHGTTCVRATRESREWQGWWVNYMALAAQELYKRPRGMTVKAIPQFATGPLGVAAKCSICRAKVYIDLLTFGEKFGEEVEKRISEIDLVIA